jgi:hypothetical protein
VNGLSSIFAFVRRRPALGPGHEVFSPATRNVRPVEMFSVHQSPDPPRQGDTPARASRQQIYTALAIAPYKAVMADEFWLSILNTPQGAQPLFGPSGIYAERQNVHKEPSDAYGSLLPLLAPVDPYPSLNVVGEQ